MPANQKASDADKVAFRKYYLQKKLVGIVNVVSTKKIIYVIVDRLSLSKLNLKHIEALQKEYNYVLQYELPIINDVPVVLIENKKTKRPKVNLQTKQIKLF